MKIMTHAPVALALFASAASAQRITLNPSTAAPGQSITATLLNDTNATISGADSCETSVLLHSGELAQGLFVNPQVCDALWLLGPGASRTVQLTAPNRPGTYTVVFTTTSANERAAARLVVGTPTPNAQQLSFYPTGITFPPRAHIADFAQPSRRTWEFANTGSTDHTFAPGDSIEVSLPGSNTALRTLQLAGLVVPAGKVTAVTLPIAGLRPTPLAVSAIFRDPGAGGIVITRTGVRVDDSRINLHLVDGHVLRPGETMNFGVTMTGFPWQAGGDPLYLFMLGLAPGSTPLPDGTTLPITIDALATASIAGLFPGLNNATGSVPNVFAQAPIFGYAGLAIGITLAYPNIPGAAGFTLRVGVLGVDSSLSVWGAAQPEELQLF